MDFPEHREAYGPLLPGVSFIGYNDPQGLGSITERTACVIVEPVRGEAGVQLPAEGFLEKLRDRCDETGALLIFDEIQTGFGRTGRMFAMEPSGVVPEIVCLSQALGRGLPPGAFHSSAQLHVCLTHNPAPAPLSTFHGHPVCCAAGLAAMEHILEEGLAEQAESKGRLYESLLSVHPAVSEVRRAGLLMAVELGESGKLYRIMELFKEEGILSDWFLFCDTAFRISPPLTITEDQIRESAEIVISCLDAL